MYDKRHTACIKPLVQYKHSKRVSLLRMSSVDEEIILINGSTKLAFHIQLLFNSMIQHGVVVTDFLKGTISPIVKDNQGDLSKSSNYRGITIGVLFSKLMEIAIDEKISPYLTSDCLKFGFKKRTSTSHALYVLKSTVNHFTERNSNAFVSFLDCSKAFDRTSHYGLFSKLIERKIPLCLLLIIIFWHLGMTSRVKWGDSFSDFNDVPLGTKQGGISGPKFFAFYIDDLIQLLRSKGVGCHVINLFVACIMFADDIALIAPTRSALQIMIDICATYRKKYCLSFNANKPKVMFFGRNQYPLKPLNIGDVSLEFVDQWKYLGTTIVAGKHFTFSARPDISNFFRASNAILNVLSSAQEHTLLSLLHSNCVPILTYACNVKEYSALQCSCKQRLQKDLRIS